MKRKNLLKLSVVVIVGIMLLFTMKNFVLADDETQGIDFWYQYENNQKFEDATVVTPTDDSNKNTNESNATGSNTESNNANTPNSAVDYNPLNENKESNVDNTSKTENVAESTIPYTGIEEVGSLLLIVMVLGVIIAIYSFKKYNEYNNI